MRQKEKPYVSDDTLEIVFEKFNEEQKNHPSEHVTKKQVYTRINKAFKEEAKLVKKRKFSYRTMERAFEKFCNKERIKKVDPAQYWIPEYLDNDREHLRKKNEFKDKIIEDQKRIKKILLEENIGLTGTVEMAKPYLNALIDCDSDEDWALLEAFFVKMRENKFEKEQVEAEEIEQELRAKVMEENEGKN